MEMQALAHECCYVNVDQEERRIRKSTRPNPKCRHTELWA